MELIEAIRGRRAVRDFTPEPADRRTIQAILALAVLAPNAMNAQPWPFAVVEGAALLAAYSTRAKRHLLETLDPHSAVSRYRDHLERTGAHVPPDDSPLHVPHARFHARLAHDFRPAELVEPIYVRVPDADRRRS